MFAGLQYAAAIRRMTDAFLACPIGETITYSKLSAAAGWPVQQRFYVLLQAKKLANSEAGANFANVRAVGYARMPSSMAHTVGAAARQRGRRLHHQAAKAIANTLAKANDISEADRMRAYREQAALGLLQHMARNRNLPAVTAEQPPPLSQVVQTSVRLLREHLTSMYG